MVVKSNSLTAAKSSCSLPNEPQVNWWDSIEVFGVSNRLPFVPEIKIISPAEAIIPRPVVLMGIEDPLLNIAKELEQVALKDDFFISRQLYPNVDFYSGIIYRAMGIPTNMFTVMFALGRLPGWLAHWREMMLGDQRINRPRQIYTGEVKRTI